LRQEYNPDYKLPRKYQKSSERLSNEDKLFRNHHIGMQNVSNSKSLRSNDSMIKNNTSNNPQLSNISSMHAILSPPSSNVVSPKAKNLNVDQRRNTKNQIIGES